MTTRIESNGIPKEHLELLSQEDLTNMLRDQILFGTFAYEVVTDEQGKLVEVNYSPVYRLEA